MDLHYVVNREGWKPWRWNIMQQKGRHVYERVGACLVFSKRVGMEERHRAGRLDARFGIQERGLGENMGQDRANP